MKKQLLALAGIAVLFAACSKKDDAPSENPTAGLLKGMYSITDTTRIEYNNDKTVSKITYGWIDGTDVGGGITTVKYADSRVSEIWGSEYAESKVFGPNELIAQFVYADNRIQKIVNPAKTADYVYYDSIRYNASGKIEKVFRMGGQKTNITKSGTDSIVWTGNNITKVVHEGFYTDNGVEKLSYTYSDTYTFDDKPNWQGPLGAATLDGGFAPEAYNTNNILTHTRTQEGQADRTNSYVFEYEKNKVIKRTATFVFDQRPGVEVTVFEYYK